MTPAEYAYRDYCTAVGGTRYDGTPIPTFEQLGDRQRAGWAAAAENGGFAAVRGDTIVSKSGIDGVIISNSNGRGGRGYWIEGRDQQSRPYECYVAEEDVASIDPFAMPTPTPAK